MLKNNFIGLADGSVKLAIMSYIYFVSCKSDEYIPSNKYLKSVWLVFLAS